LIPSYPGFKGKIEEINGDVFCVGKFSLKGQTKLQITEVPIGFTRESYVILLDKLESESKIVSYIDKCDASGFKFDITLKRGKTLTDNQIITTFKLKKKLNQNLTVINQDGQLKVYNNSLDIIKDFVDYRVTKYADRYVWLLNQANEELDVILAKVKFIEMVLNGDLDFSNKNKQQIRDDLSNDFDSEIIDILIRMPIYSLCQDELDKLKEQGITVCDKITEWKAIDVTEQFIEELKVI
jgi:DNA topoisomerase-2